jgi:hypothetical protein
MTGYFICKFDFYYLMRNGVAGYDQPCTISLFMKPKLSMQTSRVIALVGVFRHLLQCIGLRSVGARKQAGIPKVDEL